MIVLLFSLTVHEMAHAWSADRLGDPTARLLGRVSLNPIVHTDLIGTIVFPLIAMVSGAPLLGWAKPVPVNMRYLRHPRRDYVLVAAAGPASNLVLAVGDKLHAQLLVEFGQDVNAVSPPPIGNGKVHIFPWVSQLDIVKRADVVFIHGGLATIKESIAENVPIVIVPHGKDQYDNAMRIQRSGVGLVADTRDLSPESLRKLLTEAVSSLVLKRKLARMKDIFTGADNAPSSVGIINNVLA